MRNVGRTLALVLVLSTVGCDRVTKHLAVTKLADTPGQSYFAGMFRLEYAENTGAFLSLGAGLPEWARTGLLTIGPALALAAIAIWAIKHHWIGLPLVGASLVFAGGVSNLVDRVARGSVVDFMNVGMGSMRTGIFNVADIAILIGALIIVYHGSRAE